jgi:hypothetical protein
MVAADKLAFHNALLARTEDALKTEVFSLGELEEFAQYARRLGWRIAQLFSAHRPIEMPPLDQAYLNISIYSIYLTMLT